MALGYVDDKKVPNQRPPAKRAMRPKTGTGIQSPGGPVAPNATNRRPPGMRDDLISRVRGVGGLSPNDQAALTGAIRSGGRGALRNAVMGKPYAQDVLQAINGSDGAAQNAPGQRPPVASTNRVPNDGRTEVANKQDSATQAPPPGAVGGSALDTNPASATLPAPAPVATQFPTSAGLPAGTTPPGSQAGPASRQLDPNDPRLNTGGQSPGLDPRLGTPMTPGGSIGTVNANLPPVDKAQQQSGYTGQQWGQLNKKLAGVDPALVAQWRAEMQNIPAGGGARYDFLASKIAEMNNQQPGPDGGPQPVPQGPSPYPYPDGGPSPGQTPPIYVPQQIPQTQGQTPAPQQFPDIFNPVFF